MAQQVVQAEKENIQFKTNSKEEKHDQSLICRFILFPLEFGACEAASYYGVPADKKYCYESTIKLPRIC